MNSVFVEIAGREYQIKTDEDPEYIRALANHVSLKILEIKRDSGAAALDCVTMAAMDFADRLYKEQTKKPTPRKKSAPATAAEPTTLL